MDQVRDDTRKKVWQKCTDTRITMGGEKQMEKALS